GMVAGMGMAMYAMVASATYQHHGFFTPLFHISALVGSPKAMTQSMTAAMHGNTFWFTTGAAACGLLIHMFTGAMYGVGFAFLTRRVRKNAALLAGVAALLFSGLIALPVAAGVAGAGKPISDMASMVGWGTFAVEHAIFGMMLGAGVIVARRMRASQPDTA